jgi:hypothetical protein
VIHTREVKSAKNSGDQWAAWFLEEDGQWAFPPPGDDTVEDVEVWKGAACLESTEPRRESDGAGSANGS